MSSYRGTAQRSDQAKAVVAVVAVHALLATVVLTGLNVRSISRAVERMQTIDLREPPPPPPKPPPPQQQRHAAKKAAGAPAKKAELSPIVAPPAKLPVQPPIVAAKIAGTGSAASSGAGISGNGTGAGASGNGQGGGGTDYSRFTPARLVRNLARSDYQALAAGRLPAGRAMVSLRVDPQGFARDCRILRSSGDGVVDGGLCPLIVNRLRFRPALDDQGRPISYGLNYVATWRL